MINIDLENNFLSIIDYIPSFIDKNGGNHYASQLFKHLVSFFKKSEHSTTKFESIGTGSVILIENSLGILTANHVLNQIINDRNNQYYIYISGMTNQNIFKFEETVRIIDNYIQVQIDQEGDVAFISIDETKIPRERFGIELISFTPSKHITGRATSTFMMIGFPSNKNQFHKERDLEPYFNAANIITHKAKYDSTKNQLHWWVNKKDYRVESESAYIPNAKNFSPQGMSGSPLFQLYITESFTYKIHLVLVGVFTDYKKPELKYTATILESNRYSIVKNP